MTEWFVMTGIVKLVIGLMAGMEDMGLIGKSYWALPRTDLLFMSNDRIGNVIYSQTLDKFWIRKSVRTSELPSMKFGLSTDGKVVSGPRAVETIIETYYTLCKRAPHGARKKVRAFYGKSGK